MSDDKEFFSFLTKFAITNGLSEEKTKEFIAELVSLDKPRDDQIEELCKKYGISFSYSLDRPHGSVKSFMDPRIHY